MADQAGRRGGDDKKRSTGQGSGARKGGPSSRGGSGATGGRGKTSNRAPRRDDRGDKRRDDRRDDRRSGGKRDDRKGPGQRREGGGRREERAPRTEQERTQAQALYDGPMLPEDVTGAGLSAEVRAHLKSLPEKLAQRVARHLEAAGQLVDDDPETAYQHTLAAKARAPRIAVVREAVGESAYAAGHFAEALAELRAAKRMNGATAYLPIMADCHRAMGNPTRALELAKSPAIARFAAPAKAEMTIVEAGARRDLGQFDAALRILELSPLNHKGRDAWVVRLRYAYADTLEQAGRLNDALTWFHKTNAIDGDEFTDAAARAESLEGRVERD